MSDFNERLFFEFKVPGKPEPVTLEHAGITPEQAAAFLIGQGAIPSRSCSCCGAPTPINGVKARLVRQFGGCVANVGGEDKWVPATTVEGEWRTWPLSKQKGGN